MRPPTPGATAQLECVRRHICAGRTWRYAAQRAGLSPGAAWRKATALWPALAGRRPRLQPREREQIEAAIMASRESYRAIARRLAVSPDTVSRYARQLVEAECQAAGLPAVLSSCEPYRCGGCDRMVATRPCVACTATGAPRHG